MEQKKQTLSERISVFLGITVPFFGVLYAAYYVTVGKEPLDWFYIKLCLILYVLTGLGITVAFHRLFTHESFKTTKGMEFLFAVLGTLAVQGRIIEWCSRHALHHQKSDREGDPHSPWLHGEGFWGMLHGLLHAHVLWIFKTGKPPENACFERLSKNPVVSFVDRTTGLWVVLSLLVPTLIGYLHDPVHGAFLGFLWGGCVRIFIVQHITWSINSYCHIWGRRTFQTGDYSRDSVLFGLLGFGEGFHNGHHKYPQSSQHGFNYPWLDSSYMIICALEKLGLCSDVRRIGKERVERDML